jgi:hypothetical protein
MSVQEFFTTIEKIDDTECASELERSRISAAAELEAKSALPKLLGDYAVILSEKTNQPLKATFVGLAFAVKAHQEGIDLDALDETSGLRAFKERAFNLVPEIETALFSPIEVPEA